MISLKVLIKSEKNYSKKPKHILIHSSDHFNEILFSKIIISRFFKRIHI